MFHVYFRSRSQYQFIFGKYDLRINTPHVVVRQAEKILAHKHHEELSRIYDVALVKFDVPVAFNNFVRPICRPTFNSERPDLTIFKQCYACGWGMTKSNASGSV